CARQDYYGSSDFDNW
nr:immunoglobulin heavy chain junction region [Mus musculus]